MGIITKIFGDANEKYLKKLEPIVKKINSLEPEFEKFSTPQLKEKTNELKERLKKGEKLGDILPEAFALVREAGKRTLNQCHFDVQLIGGIVLHQGKIAEMKTGEGKTLAATLPLYLNALTGKGVHLITVNDYLTKRDTIWMGQIYDLLGLSVGCIVHDAAFLYDSEFKEKDQIRDKLGSFKVIEDFLRPISRREAYLADITYGTNNEFGFDYLRDNMAYDLSQQVQRGFNYAIVDEVDSILIDQARTPLIISIPTEDVSEKYNKFAKLISILKEKEDYVLDEKIRVPTFTESGQEKIIKHLAFDPWVENDVPTTHQLEAALKARTLFRRDRDYIVKDGQIIIVDELTGRIMPGRRWSGGLHQAIEAKEGVNIQPESLTFATITFQNLFRMYKKLAGMTGTASISSEEFDKVYKLEVIVIPTNKPMIRIDLPDRIYMTKNGKLKSIIKEIKERHKNGQPLLVGTGVYATAEGTKGAMEKNQKIKKILEIEGISCEVLDAKDHEREGQIIAQAGRSGAVTVANNMAGRGVDIILGGNPPDKEEQKKVIESGGLHIIGTERHEARRIDNQLRGRSGRQGDPGSSQFFVSLEDDLMRIFGGDRIKGLMETMRVPEDQPIEAGIISKAIESAQSKVEGMNFDARNHVLEYDDVMNKHREVFYRKRKEILEKSKNLKPYILEIIKKAGFTEKDYLKREKELGEENMRQVEKLVCLKVLDTFWLEHLENMEYLRDSVRLRAYGQQDPLVEYKSEGHKMFQKLLQTIEATIANAIFKAELRVQSRDVRPASAPLRGASAGKVGRNDPCPCGSGKKYKKCHGKI